MDKEFDEEAQLQAIKDNEEFFKKIENQSHNFINKYTVLDYMQDQYRKVSDMSNTQEDKSIDTEKDDESSYCVLRANENMDMLIMLSPEERKIINEVRQDDRLRKILTNPDPYEFSHIRLEALKLAVEMVKNINHFESKYDGINELLKDVDVVHEIAESNFKYIVGEK